MLIEGAAQLVGIGLVLILYRTEERTELDTVQSRGQLADALLRKRGDHGGCLRAVLIVPKGDRLDIVYGLQIAVLLHKYGKRGLLRQLQKLAHCRFIHDLLRGDTAVEKLRYRDVGKNAVDARHTLICIGIYPDHLLSVLGMKNAVVRILALLVAEKLTEIYIGEKLLDAVTRKQSLQIHLPLIRGKKIVQLLGQDQTVAIHEKIDGHIRVLQRNELLNQALQRQGGNIYLRIARKNLIRIHAELIQRDLGQRQISAADQHAGAGYESKNEHKAEHDDSCQKRCYFHKTSGKIHSGKEARSKVIIDQSTSTRQMPRSLFPSTWIISTRSLCSSAGNCVK